MLLAILIGVPLGILLTRRPKWKAFVLGSTNVVQTIPSLALFGLLLPLPWLGARADRLAIIALALYALLPVVRNTYVGISGISAPVREAAIAMGLTSGQLLWHVELPLALPVMLAGIRVAAVITIGVATIAAAIGAGGLGEFIFRGIAMVDNGVILAGAIPAALMALGCGPAPERLRKADGPQDPLTWTVAASWLDLLCFPLLVASPQQNAADRRLQELHRTTDPGRTAGAIPGERLPPADSAALLSCRHLHLSPGLACRTHRHVRRVHRNRARRHPERASSGDSQSVYQQVKDAYKRKFNLDVMPPLGFNNSFAMVMRGDDARRLKVTTLSQLASFAPHLRLGVGYEFLERQDGYKGLVSTYGLKFAEAPRVMDLGLLYRALQNKSVDVVAGNNTDGLIAALGFVVLEDDKHYFPPYDAVPIVRPRVFQECPAGESGLRPAGRPHYRRRYAKDELRRGRREEGRRGQW